MRIPSQDDSTSRDPIDRLRYFYFLARVRAGTAEIPIQEFFPQHPVTRTTSNEEEIAGFWIGRPMEKG
jgi:hypothetical protein